jgi:mannitol-1-phosphate/altronate dehydrogenase
MSLTPEQMEGHRTAMRGMNKDAASQAEQLVAARTERQRRERPPVQCICCDNYRDPRSYPVCDACVERRRMGVQ